VEELPQGFVALKSLKEGAVDSNGALEQIRRIYFTTTRRTINHDVAHAIELLKSLPTEDERQKAAVYMDGLAQMRSDWSRSEGGQKESRRGTERPKPHRQRNVRKRKEKA
jgi:hypothetical protein